MGYLADKAIDLVGHSRGEYQCNQVINQIFYDKKNAGLLAKDYLTWGVETSAPAEGVVIVGKDGAHVGFFINETEFIHSSSQDHQVIRVGLDQRHWAFPQGWVYRKER